MGYETETEAGRGRSSGWQQRCGLGLGKKAVAIHRMSKAEGGTGHCANIRRSDWKRVKWRGCEGLWGRTVDTRLWSLGEMSVWGWPAEKASLKSGREEGGWKETEDQGLSLGPQLKRWLQRDGGEKGEEAEKGLRRGSRRSRRKTRRF